MTKLIRWTMLLSIAICSPGCLTLQVWDSANCKVASDPAIVGAYRDDAGRPRMLLMYSAGGINPKLFYTSIALREDGSAEYPFGFTAAATRPATQPGQDEYAGQRNSAEHAKLHFISDCKAKRIIADHHLVKPPPPRTFLFIFRPAPTPWAPWLPYKVPGVGQEIRVARLDSAPSDALFVRPPDELPRETCELAMERLKAIILTPPAIFADLVGAIASLF